MGGQVVGEMGGGGCGGRGGCGGGGGMHAAPVGYHHEQQTLVRNQEQPLLRPFPPHAQAPPLRPLPRAQTQPVRREAWASSSSAMGAGGGPSSDPAGDAPFASLELCPCSIPCGRGACTVRDIGRTPQGLSTRVSARVCTRVVSYNLP